MRVRVLAACLLALLGRPTLARACELAGPAFHATDPAEVGVDTTLPAAPEVAVFDVERGLPAMDGCEARSTCHAVATITLQAAATDDRTPGAEMGFLVTLEAGTLPQGLALPDGSIRSFDGQIRLHWFDGRFEDPFDVTFSVAAVDLAGNVGPVTMIEVSDAGRSEGGCATTPVGRSVGAALLLAAVLLVLRRRR